MATKLYCCGKPMNELTGEGHDAQHGDYTFVHYICPHCGYECRSESVYVYGTAERGGKAPEVKWAGPQASREQVL